MASSPSPASRPEARRRRPACRKVTSLSASAVARPRGWPTSIARYGRSAAPGPWFPSTSSRTTKSAASSSNPSTVWITCASSRPFEHATIPARPAEGEPGSGRPRLGSALAALGLLRLGVLPGVSLPVISAASNIRARARGSRGTMLMSWLWAVFTVLAAGGQVLRNAQQKELTSTLGTVGATHVRFLFGLPFGLVFLALVLLATGQGLPALNGRMLAWSAAAALAQIAATALLLAAMRDRSF